MERDELQPGRVYAYLLRPGTDDPYEPVKLLDRQHTYYWGGSRGWVRDDEWTVETSPVYPQDSHGVLVAGVPTLFWPAAWQHLDSELRAERVKGIDLRAVLEGSSDVAIPVSVIEPDRLVMEWDELMRPVHRQRAEDSRRFEDEQREWALKRAEEDFARDRDKVALTRSRTGVKVLNWCLALTVLAAIVVPVGMDGDEHAVPIWVRVMLVGEVDGRAVREFFLGGQYGIPVGLLLVVCLAVRSVVKSRTRALEAKYPRW